MSSRAYAAALYCSKVTRKWTQDSSEESILFLLCNVNSAKPYRFHTSKPSKGDDEEFRPLPFVKGQLLNNTKLNNYTWGSIKEFIVMVPWSDEYPEPEDDKSGVHEKRRLDKSGSKTTSSAASPRKEDKSEGKTPRKKKSDKDEKTTTKKEDKESSRGKKEKDDKDSSRVKKEKKEDKPSKPAATKTIKPTIDPELEVLNLSSIAINFINEPDGQERDQSTGGGYAQSERVNLTDKEVKVLDQLDSDLEQLEQLIGGFKETVDDKQNSSFTPLGIASYYGMQYEYQDEINSPPKVAFPRSDSKLNSPAHFKVLQKQSAVELPKMKPPVTGAPPTRPPPTGPNSSTPNNRLSTVPPPVVGAPPTRNLPPPVQGRPPSKSKASH